MPLLLLAAAAPEGQQIVLHGNSNGAMPCAACHGENGAGKPSTGAPALVGEPASGIVSELDMMASGQGGNPLMRSIAAALTPQERQAVAAYFSCLPKPATKNRAKVRGWACGFVKQFETPEFAS